MTPPNAFRLDPVFFWGSALFAAGVPIGLCESVAERLADRGLWPAVDELTGAARAIGYASEGDFYHLAIKPGRVHVGGRFRINPAGWREQARVLGFHPDTLRQRARSLGAHIADHIANQRETHEPKEGENGA